MGDENDPVLIPSLPEPWEGLVRGMTESIANEYDAMLGGDMRVIPDATHAASRAERDLRVALGDLLRYNTSLMDSMKVARKLK